MAGDREDIVGGEWSEFATWFLAEHAIMRGDLKKQWRGHMLANIVVPLVDTQSTS